MNTMFIQQRWAEFVGLIYIIYVHALAHGKYGSNDWHHQLSLPLRSLGEQLVEEGWRVELSNEEGFE